MHYAKLTYARNLNRERRKLEKNSCQEHEKRITNHKKIARIDATLNEVQEELQKVSHEISDWLDNVDLPYDIKEQIRDYFINGNDYYDSNFFRYAMTPFGENK